MVTVNRRSSVVACVFLFCLIAWPLTGCGSSGAANTNVTPTSTGTNSGSIVASSPASNARGTLQVNLNFGSAPGNFPANTAKVQIILLDQTLSSEAAARGETRAPVPSETSFLFPVSPGSTGTTCLMSVFAHVFQMMIIVFDQFDNVIGIANNPLIKVLQNLVTALDPSPTLLIGLAVTPKNTTVPQGQTLQLDVTETYADRHTTNIASALTWSSNDSNVASVDSSGVVTGVNEGIANITGSLQGFKERTTIIVTTASPSPSPSPSESSSPSPSPSASPPTLTQTSFVVVENLNGSSLNVEKVSTSATSSATFAQQISNTQSGFSLTNPPAATITPLQNAIAYLSNSNGIFVYAVNGSTSVYENVLDPSTGKLSANPQSATVSTLANSTLGHGNFSAVAACVDPSGKYLYVLGTNPSIPEVELEVHTINAANGTLGPAVGTAFDVNASLGGNQGASTNPPGALSISTIASTEVLIVGCQTVFASYTVNPVDGSLNAGSNLGNFSPQAAIALPLAGGQGAAFECDFGALRLNALTLSPGGVMALSGLVENAESVVNFTSATVSGQPVLYAMELLNLNGAAEVDAYTVTSTSPFATALTATSLNNQNNQTVLSLAGDTSSPPRFVIAGTIDIANTAGTNLYLIPIANNSTGGLSATAASAFDGDPTVQAGVTGAGAITVIPSP